MDGTVIVRVKRNAFDGNTAYDAVTSFQDGTSCPTTELRNQLAEHYDPLASGMAYRLSQRASSPLVGLDDLKTVARIALMKAIEAFDLGRGLKFPTYGSHVIRGALLDELRRVDPLSRHYRRLSTSHDRQRRQLAQHLGRPARDRDLARHLGTTEERVFHARVPFTAALDAWPGGLGDSHPGQITDGQPAASVAVQREDLRDLVLHGMSVREKRLVVMYYYEGRPMRSIAAALGCSDARISQMHQNILCRIRSKLADRVDEFSL